MRSPSSALLAWRRQPLSFGKRDDLRGTHCLACAGTGRRTGAPPRLVRRRQHPSLRRYAAVAPLTAGSSPYAATTSDDADIFSVVEMASGELAGEALLVRTLCEYGFRIRGLHRLQVETAEGNAAMARIASRVGFRQEGRLFQPSGSPVGSRTS